MSSEPVGDVQLIDGSKLPNDFACFRNDELYFISHCVFYDNFSDSRPVVRCIALTPSALFVTSVNGQMDRAFRYDIINKIIHQFHVRRRIIGTEKLIHFVFKIENEPDCHISINGNSESNKNEFEHAKNFMSILTSIVNAKKESAASENSKIKKTPLELFEAPPEADINEFVSNEKPKSFLTPTEIIKMNLQRKKLMSIIDTLESEIAEVKKEIDGILPSLKEGRKSLKDIQGSVGSDLDKFVAKKEKLRVELEMARGKLTSIDMEKKETMQNTARLNEQLSEEKAHYDTLVKTSVSTSDNAATQEQEKIMLLRQKAQQREKEAAISKLNDLVEKLKVLPVYSGHDAMAQNATKLENEINVNIEKWVREMEAANKVDTFIDHMRAEAERLNRHFDDQYQLKMQLIAEIEGEEDEHRKSRHKKGSSKKHHSKEKEKKGKCKVPSPVSSDDDISLIDDDDLLGGTKSDIDDDML